MKSVLIIISSFRWGGINRALQSWLERIDPSEIKVDVFVMVHSGNYDGAFHNCTILPKNYWVDALIDHARLKKGVTKLVSGGMKVLNRLTKEKFQHWVFKKTGNKLASAKRYDAVIGWHEGVPTTFVSHINHPNKISWIHCDYANYTDSPRERSLYENIHKIVCVSKYCRGTFLRFFPDMENKVYAIYNILDVDDIKWKALEPMDIEYDKTKFNIVSVGRVSPVKQFSRIPEIARKVIDAGCDIHWYIVGPTYPGVEYDTLMANMERYDVKDVVTLTGGKENPYPYVVNADLLVCTSLSEALPYTISEAKVLGIPAVSTNFGSACELIDDGKDGFITKIDQIPDYIISLSGDRQTYSSAKDLLKVFGYDNARIMRQIYHLFI